METILILGASSDIGRELIRAISVRECRILAHYNERSAAIEKIAEEVNGEIIPLKADLANQQATISMIETIQREYGAPQKVVHLPAPKFRNIRFATATWADFQLEMDVQLRSAALVLGAFLPKMAQAREGKVVLMLSSVTLGVPPAALAHYTVAKYALLGLMKSLAAEYASKGININAVSPSMVETEFLSLLPQRLVELTAEGHPLRRNARPSDVVPIVKFLLSPDANYLNGANLPATGGAIF